MIDKKTIDFYVGRNVDISEYILRLCDDNSLIIDKWDITDKPQPTIAELEALQPQVEAQEKGEAILAKIIELDSKRSRAFFEPAEKEVGLTWLDYYNQEIADLRNLIV